MHPVPVQRSRTRSLDGSVCGLEVSLWTRCVTDKAVSHLHKSVKGSRDRGAKLPWDEHIWFAEKLQITEEFCAQDILQRFTSSSLIDELVQLQVVIACMFVQPAQFVPGRVEPSRHFQQV